MSSIESPFSPTGLQPAIAERDQRIAVLEYQLRCVRAEAEARERAAAAAAAPVERPAASVSWLSSWLGSDEGGQPITQRERETLNALVRRYLLARGYKATSAAFAEEAGGPGGTAGGSSDASFADAELELLALPRTQGSSSDGGGGRALLSLLGMHRKRIAPIQQLAESEARNDSTISSLRAEVGELHAQLDIVRAELAKAEDRAAQLEQDLVHARTIGGRTAAALSDAPPVVAVAAPAPAAPAAAPRAVAAAPPLAAGPAASAAPAGSGAGGSTMSLVHAPALLRVVNEALPALAACVVTKQRGALVPVYGAAVAAETGVDARRTLLEALLGLFRRPTQAERHLVQTQVAVLAGRLGKAVAETEIMPAIMALAKTSRTKERKALAAML